jgi:uncharacterized protein
MTIPFNEHLSTFIVSISIAAFINSIAFRCGFFKRMPSPKDFDETQIQLIDVIGMFALFLALQILTAPFVAFLYYSIREGHIIKGNLLPYITEYAHGWFNLLSIAAGASGVLFGSSWLKIGKYHQVWGQNSHFFWKNFCFGSFSWVMSFPIAIAAGELSWLGLYSLFGVETHLEQVAVKHLNQVSIYPVVFSLTIASVVLVAPLVEEILFRGLLQSWFITKVGSSKGVIITSLIFSLFHYSLSQGMANIILMASLFVLSCFLGFIYIRQRSLWASIGLHVTFNSVSVIMIILK